MSKNIYSYEDGYSYIDLYQYGIDNLNSADVLFKYGPEYFDSAGYLCHLGFELILKSLCLYSNRYFEGEHDLKNIVKLVDKIITFDKQKKRVLNVINTYKELRYPNRNNPTEVGIDDLPSIHMLKAYIIDNIPTNMKKELEKLSVLNKGNRVLMYKNSI